MKSEINSKFELLKTLYNQKSTTVTDSELEAWFQILVQRKSLMRFWIGNLFKDDPPSVYFIKPVKLRDFDDFHYQRPSVGIVGKWYREGRIDYMYNRILYNQSEVIN